MISLMAMNEIIRVAAMMVQKEPGCEVTTVSLFRVKLGTGYPNQSHCFMLLLPFVLIKQCACFCLSVFFINFIE